jgi:GntR family transcriptional repressor for pyruvate dehydrogenase complex
LAVVREAMKRLEALGVLGATQGSGTVVLPFRWMPLLFEPSLFLYAVKRIGIRDLWETRRLLEGQIVRLAAERATADNLKAIRAVLEKASPLPFDYDASQALNRKFHTALAAASQNAVLIDLLTPLLEIRIAGVAHHFTNEMCGRTWKAHTRIYAAVARHDVGAAELAMRDHFTIGPIAVDAEPTREGDRAHVSKKTPRPRSERSRSDR